MCIRDSRSCMHRLRCEIPHLLQHLHAFLINRFHINSILAQHSTIYALSFPYFHYTRIIKWAKRGASLRLKHHFHLIFRFFHHPFHAGSLGFLILLPRLPDAMNHPFWAAKCLACWTSRTLSLYWRINCINSPLKLFLCSDSLEQDRLIREHLWYNFLVYLSFYSLL